MKKTIFVGLFAVTGLAACGGGGSNEATYRQQVDSLIKLQVESDNILPTPVADLPTTGSAEYNGVAFVTAETDPSNQNVDLSLIGDMSVTADFAARNVSGTADNFRGATIESDPNAPEPTSADDVDFSKINQSDYAGTLNVTGAIAASNGAITGTMSGTLTGAGNTVVVSSNTQGAFGGANHEFIGIESGDDVQVNGIARSGFSGVIGKR